MADQDELANKSDTSRARDEHGRLLPGHTANRSGRPKTGAEFREWMSEDDPSQKVSRRLRLRERMYALAVSDDDLKVAIKAAELLMAYDMGRPPQRIEDENGKAIPVGVIFLPPESE